ncbi:hypothetical protein CYMTET_22504, partial [Cymbomonas tetramitiformis]
CVARDDRSCVARDDRSCVARDDRSSVVRDDRSCVARDDRSCVARDDARDDVICTSATEAKGAKGAAKTEGKHAKPARKAAVKQEKEEKGAAKKPAEKTESEPEQSFLASVLSAQQGNPKPGAGVVSAPQKSGVVSVVTRTNRPPSGKKAFAVGAAAAKELLGLEAGGSKVGGTAGLGLGAGWDAPIVVGSSESSSVAKVTETQVPDRDKPATGIKRKSAAERGTEDKSVAPSDDTPRPGGHPTDVTPSLTTPTPKKKKGRWALKAATD